MHAYTMKEDKEIVYVVETTELRDNKRTMECFNFDTLDETQEFADKCMEEQKYSLVALLRETHTRRLLASSTR